MDKVKKVYVDSRFRTNDSDSNSDFKFELNEALDLPDNTVCYVDDISIPHTWRTIESYNNKFYIILRTTVVNPDTTATYNWFPYMITIPDGNYDGYRLASGMQDLLNSIEINFTFEVKYNTATGSIKIEETTEGSGNAFDVPTDLGIATWDTETNNQYPWRNIEGTIVYPDVAFPQSINGVLRNTEMVPVNLSFMYSTYQSGFLDLLNIHNIYIHCPNLGHFNSIGVRGENTIIKKVPVSSSFGYLIIDTVVSPHDKMDVSRQNVKTIHITLKDVSGNVINLHGANCSLSLIFVTTE
jgi:hypothetical protein